MSFNWTRAEKAIVGLLLSLLLLIVIGHFFGPYAGLAGLGAGLLWTALVLWKKPGRDWKGRFVKGRPRR